MLDIKKIRQNPQEIADALKRRDLTFDTSKLLTCDEQRRQMLAQVEEKKAARNTAGKKMGAARKSPNSEKAVACIMAEMQQLAEDIEALDTQIAGIDKRIEQQLLVLPNLPHATVPETDTILSQNGSPKQFAWEPKSCFELANDHKMLLPGLNSTDTVFCGKGAALRRALITYLLDELAKANCLETDISNADVSESAYVLPSLCRDKIYFADELPVCNAVYLPCSHNKQGAKTSVVELFEIVAPQNSLEDAAKMAEVLQKLFELLELPCRAVLLCAEKLDFDAAKTFSIEVWMPALKNYVEAARCFTCEDFVARRTGIRFRTTVKEKPLQAHTLSGYIDLNKIFNALLENGQNDDASVSLPSALSKYTGFESVEKNFSHVSP